MLHPRLLPLIQVFALVGSKMGCERYLKAHSLAVGAWYGGVDIRPLLCDVGSQKSRSTRAQLERKPRATRDRFND